MKGGPLTVGVALRELGGVEVGRRGRRAAAHQPLVDLHVGGGVGQPQVLVVLVLLPLQRVRVVVLAAAVRCASTSTLSLLVKRTAPGASGRTYRHSKGRRGRGRARGARDAVRGARPPAPPRRWRPAPLATRRAANTPRLLPTDEHYIRIG